MTTLRGLVLSSTLALSFLWTGLNPPEAGAQEPVFGFADNSLDRFYDASNAVSASQIVAVQAPLLTGEAGDWRLAVSPAYVRVKAEPLEFAGGSLDFDYSRLVDGKWGFYVIALTNYVRTLATSDSGWPHPRLLRADFEGLDALPSFKGTYPAGGSILTTIQSAGFIYRTPLEISGSSFPVALFGGPVLTQSFARDLRFDFAFSGTYNGGEKTYRAEGTSGSRLDAYFYGGALGAATEIALGKFKVVPHAYGVLLGTKLTGTTAWSAQQYCGGTLCGEGSDSYRNSWSIGTFWIIVPGLDVIYRDWGLGINLVEPFTGAIAKRMGLLHGARPTVNISLTQYFGRYAK